MPVSHPNHIPALLHLVQEFEPARILDVGIGLGTMGLLLRQVLEVSRGRLHRPEWMVRIEGVEIFPPYRNPLWTYAYDAIHEEDIRTFLATGAPRFDLVLCCDVLEHFPLAEARRILDDLLRLAGAVIITTPTAEYAQGAWFGNEAETHRCTLRPADLPHLVAGDSVGVTSWYVCSADPGAAARLRTIAARAPRVSNRRSTRERLVATLRGIRRRLKRG